MGAEERGALRGQAGSLTPPRAYPTVPKGGGHVNLEHARVGKKVRVRDDRRRPELRGRWSRCCGATGSRSTWRWRWR